MAKVGSQETMELVAGIAADVKGLVGDHLELLRSEVKEELNHAKSALVSFGVGSSMLALGGILSTQMAVHLVHRGTRLPLWASFGLVASVVAGVGYSQIVRAQDHAAQIKLGLPPATMATLEEDVEWIQGKPKPKLK